MSTMTSFKRKRIEKWCQDVAQYLQDGTICKTVIGNIAEDAICGNGVSGPIRVTPSVGTINNNISENILENFALINKNSTHNAGLNISSKNLNAKVDLAFKKAAQALNSSSNGNNTNNNNINTNDNINNNNNNNNINTMHRDVSNGLMAGASHGGVGTMDGSVNISGSFPVVKFAYSHYHEQRRKIDRLVQGLPILNANGVASLERPSSKCSTEDHVPIIIVNGEEPVRSSNTRSRSSSQPRRSTETVPSRYAINNNSNHNNNSNKRSGGPTPSSSAKYLQQIPSPTSGRRNANTPTRRSNPLHRTASGSKIFDSRLQSQHFSTNSNTININSNNNNTNNINTNNNNSNNINTNAINMDTGVNLSANDRVSRIKTAPVPNRNLHRARQRILSRRGNRVLEHTSQIPLQNCWAMAELTW